MGMLNWHGKVTMAPLQSIAGKVSKVKCTFLKSVQRTGSMEFGLGKWEEREWFVVLLPHMARHRDQQSWVRCEQILEKHSLPPSHNLPRVEHRRASVDCVWQGGGRALPAEKNRSTKTPSRGAQVSLGRLRVTIPAEFFFLSFSF